MARTYYTRNLDLLRAVLASSVPEHDDGDSWGPLDRWQIGPWVGLDPCGDYHDPITSYSVATPARCRAWFRALERAAEHLGGSIRFLHLGPDGLDDPGPHRDPDGPLPHTHLAFEREPNEAVGAPEVAELLAPRKQLEAAGRTPARGPGLAPTPFA